jgi:hypothetical protein
LAKQDRIHQAFVLYLFALMPLANLHHLIALIFGLMPFGWLCTILPNPYL